MDVERVTDHPDVWEKVVRKLRTNAMPPPGMPRPDQATYDVFSSSLEGALDRAAASNLNAGRPVLHRLNRVEYTNAIRDLLGLEIDGRSLLPADDSSYGFDNMAEALSVSPGLLERYMSAAAKISRLAVGFAGLPVFETYKVPESLVQEDRVSDDLPFGSRGGTVIRHQFPLDGEYVLKIRLQRTIGGDIRGLAESSQVEVRLDGARVGVFTVGGKFKDQSARRAANTEFQEYLRTADAGLEVRVPVKAGVRLVGAAFAKATAAVPEGLAPGHWPVTSYTYAIDVNAQMGVDSIQIGGPYNTATSEGPGHAAIFVCHPGDVSQEQSCAKTILATLARRAYRRPVTAEDVQALLVSYKAGRTLGTFETGVEWALESILVDPEFLFRVERDPVKGAPGSSYRLSDFELASRLSFFLWSSIPDDELLDVATRGHLQAPAVLEQQVRRMLVDPRSKALISNFADQWLGVRRMSAVTPDPAAFPDFDENLREAFQRETELFLESQLNEDHSVVDLLTANYTFVNERLARHYGIPNIYGNHFRRVALADDHRRGLIGQGSVLTVTSYANRTSPVLRGKWVLDNILGAPPPPPPPNVPVLKENGEEGQPTTVRERLEEHRKNPVCASCHARMDPLGFALENFDGVG
jgi:hypothetical protein